MTPNNNSGCDSNKTCWKLFLLVDCKELMVPWFVKNEQQPETNKLDLFIQQLNTDINTTLGTQEQECRCELGNPRLQTKTLPVGDFMVVARCYADETGTDDVDPVLDERVLSIIERKTGADLVRSMKLTYESKQLTRLEAQAWKMKHCCGNNVYKSFLVEGNPWTGPHVTKNDVRRAYGFQNQVSTWDGFTLKKTVNTVKTKEFLVSHLCALQKRYNTPGEKPALLKLPTFDELRQACKDIFKEPSFQYYVSLRKIKGIGDVLAMRIMKVFATAEGLESAVANEDQDELSRVLKGDGRRAINKNTLSLLVNKFRCPSTKKSTGNKGSTQSTPTPFQSPTLQTSKKRASVTPSPQRRKRAKK